MDKNRIGIEEVDMKLADWLANNILSEDVVNIEEFISYLKNAKTDNDGYVGDFIPLRASGYTNTPKNNPNGKKFLALKIETDYKKQKEIYESGTTSTSPVDAPIGEDTIDF